MKKLLEIANLLEEKGLTKEANKLKALAAGNPFGPATAYLHGLNLRFDAIDPADQRLISKQQGFKKGVEDLWIAIHDLSEMLQNFGYSTASNKLHSIAVDIPREVTVFNSCLRDVEEWVTRMKPKTKLVTKNPEKLKTYWEKLSKAMQEFEKYSVGMP